MRWPKTAIRVSRLGHGADIYYEYYGLLNFIGLLISRGGGTSLDYRVGSEKDKAGHCSVSSTAKVPSVTPMSFRREFGSVERYMPLQAEIHPYFR